jgi:uncharacterized membrane protein
MNFDVVLLPPAWQWGAAALCLALLGLGAWRAPWSRLRDEHQLHVYLGTCVALMLLWTIRVLHLPGLEYHFLGATLLTLMFGWRLAAVGMALVLAAAVLSGANDWRAYPANLLVTGLLPVAVSHAVLRVVDTRLPANFFIYVFVGAFFGAGLAMLAGVLGGAALLWLSGAYAPGQLYSEYLQLAPLLVFPEAFVTGFVLTVMVVYRPEWVASFDDERYLRGK